MVKRLERKFYTGRTLTVAQKLLGKYIVRKFRKKILKGMIIETEAYLGPKDRASHAFNWKLTPRNIIEYFEGGYIYIYLVYGMYWQLNITTFKEGYPECVLIRGLKLENGEIINGPGKVCQYLKLNSSFYGEDLTKSQRIWLEDWGIKIKKKDILRTSRIGIDYAGPYWASRKWRFLVKI